MTQFENLAETLRFRAQTQPDARAFTWLEGDSEENSLTYGALDRRARAIAARLVTEGITGQRVLLLHVPGLDFVAALYGCFYAGAIAVPAHAPDSMLAARALPRLRGILDDAAPALVMSTSTILARNHHLFAEAPDLEAHRWIAGDTIAAEGGEAEIQPLTRGGDVAFLQYTSGSTSTPKGVVVGHSQALANLGMIHAAYRSSIRIDAPKDGRPCAVMWIPFYHDMGLIGGILMSPFMGGHTVLMSPLHFLRRPLGWLRAIQRYQADYSACPNFALDQCARRASTRAADPDLTGLDLRSLTTLIIGAETVRPDTLHRFAATFAPHGLRAEALRPAYGLAEAVLAVSTQAEGDILRVVGFDGESLKAGRALHREGAGGRLFTSSGKPMRDTQVAIVDPHTREQCPPGQVGEIWVSGPSVALGYFGRSEESEATFGAQIAGNGRGAFLRTGDLGFFWEGELFVTGRRKDLIILRGQNIHPEDVEATVESCHPRLRPGGVAAFALETDDGESLGIVAEIDLRGLSDTPEERQSLMDRILLSIRESLGREHGVAVFVAALIRTNALPRTSSGKNQRSVTREALLAGRLPVLSRWDAPSSSSIASALEAQIAELVGLPAGSVDLEQSWQKLGLDSLALVELMARLEGQIGLAFPMREWLGGQSVRALAERLAAVSLTHTSVPRTLTSPGEGKPGAEDWAPMTHGQRAMWLLARTSPESTAYNVAFAVRLAPPVNEAALQRAFGRLVARHSALRTVFALRDEQPVQRVLDSAEPFFGVIDLTASDPGSLSDRVADEAHRPFHLEREPPLRVHLFRGALGVRVLLVTVHHIAVDLWSMLVLAEDLGALYTAEERGTEAALRPTGGTSADFARFQAELLSSAEGERLFAYWRDTLAGDLPVLDLATDRPRPSVATHRGSVHRASLSPRLSEKLRGLAREKGTTLYALLLAAFQVFLHRHTGEDDILVGSPVAGRGHPAFRDTVGYFVNPVVMRARFAGDPTFAAALEQTAQAVSGALEHQEYPFPLLVERLAPRRDPGRSPLFQAVFVLQKPHRLKDAAPFVLGRAGARLSLGAFEVESFPLPERAAVFDLTLSMIEVDGELHAAFQYSTDLFDAPTIARMAARFEVLLRGIVADPSRRLSELPLLTDEERHTLCRWNDTKTSGGVDRLAHELFEEQARNDPHAVAVEYRDERLTYGELDAQANQLAHHLADLGVGPDVLVGLSAERSLDFVVGLLAVLKAGGAYVALDPSYPADRLSFMVDDASMPVLLVQAHLVGKLPPNSAAIVSLGADARAWTDRPSTPLNRRVHPDNPVFVVYTSGSTGRPKGVINTHAGLSARISYQRKDTPIGPGDRVLFRSPQTFDASVLEWAFALCNGATLVVSGSSSPAGVLDREMDARGITVVFMPPALLGVFSSAAPTLRLVIVGGDVLLPEVAKQWSAPGRRVSNIYGPTEFCIWGTDHTFDAGTDADIVPIGRPIADVRVYVLDASLRPAPIGVVGELFLAGAGMARGYLNRPGITAERFVPDPFSVVAGDRMYRTGDRARWRRDGKLEFHGRVDHQVKLRGFRVELGEVEAALHEHPAIAEAAVVLRRERDDARLCGYVTRREGAVVSREALRAYLRERLPEYMVPSFLVVLERMPLSAHGKIDRLALPPPPREMAAASVVLPRDDVQAVLVRVLAEVLGVEQVSIHAHFFDDLGATSISLIRAASAASREFGAEVPVGQFFEHPTVEALSLSLRGTAAEAAVVRTSSERNQGRREAILRARHGDRKRRGKGDG
jgi:amino acid adenylation domain-containing protein